MNLVRTSVGEIGFFVRKKALMFCRHTIKLAIFFAVFSCIGCTKHYVRVHKIPIDRSSLASTFTRGPDPLQKNPPTGHKIFIQWWLPIEIDPQDVNFNLYVIYKNLDEEAFPFKVNNRVGAKSFSFTGKEYQGRKGLFSYKVVVTGKDGKVLDIWKQRMWVNIIRGSDEMQAIHDDQKQKLPEKKPLPKRPKSPDPPVGAQRAMPL